MTCTHSIEERQAMGELCPWCLNREVTTLRFWREEGLHEIRRLKDEIKGLRERLVELENRSNNITSWNRERDK